VETADLQLQQPFSLTQAMAVDGLFIVQQLESPTADLQMATSFFR